MKKKAIDIFVGCITLFASAKAQTTGYLYGANVDSVKQSGFYNIALTPSISAHIKTNFSDFRIVNGAGKWIPHLIREPNLERHVESVVMDLPIIKKETKASTAEVIVKSDSIKISNLVLQIKNTDAERFCSISGSDNATDWFTINDSILIQPQESKSNTATFRINFSPVNYQYYKLIIYNKNRAPFNITGIGYQTLAEGPGIPVFYPPVENPVTSITQKDSGKISYIKVVQNNQYHFNEMQLKISGPQYYNRVAELYVPATVAHSFTNPGELITSFTISNNNTLQYKFPKVKAAVFYLLIHNQDNLPVKVDTVSTYSNYTIATAYLEAGASYKILLDNLSAKQPAYDLEQLNIADKNLLPQIATAAIVPMPQNAVTAKAANSNKWMIWLIIAVAAIAMAFFTYKLTTEMNKSKG